MIGLFRLNQKFHAGQAPVRGKLSYFWTFRAEKSRSTCICTVTVQIDIQRQRRAQGP